MVAHRRARRSRALEASRRSKGTREMAFATRVCGFHFYTRILDVDDRTAGLCRDGSEGDRHCGYAFAGTRNFDSYNRDVRHI